MPDLRSQILLDIQRQGGDALDDTVVKLKELLSVLTVLQGGFTQVNTASASAAGAVATTTTAVAAQATAADQCAAEFAMLNEALRDLGNNEDFAAAATRRTTKAQEDLEEKTKKSRDATWMYTRMVAQLGYGLGDLMQTSGGWERKLMAITNNIQFALAPMGTFGVTVGVVATAFAAMAMNKDAILDFLGLFKDQITVIPGSLKDINKQIEDFNKQKIKTTVEMDQLEAYQEKLRETKEDLKEFQKLAGMTTAYQKESGRTYQETIGATGKAKDIAEAMKDTRIAEMEAAHPAESRGHDEAVRQAEKELADVMFLTTGPGSEFGDAQAHAAMRDAAEKKLNAAKERRRQFLQTRGQQAEKHVGDITGKAFAGDEAAQAELRRLLTQSGQGDLATLLDVVGSPEEMERRAQDRREVERQQHQATLNRALDARLGRKLTEEGKANEAPALAQVGKDRALVKALEDAGKIEGREKEQAARQAARAAKAAPRQNLERDLVNQYHVTPAQAHQMAPAVQRGMGAGMSQQDAAAAALAQMQNYLQHQQTIMLRQQAMFEQMNGMFGQASQQLMMQEAQQRAFQARARGSGMPSVLPVLPQ